MTGRMTGTPVLRWADPPPLPKTCRSFTDGRRATRESRMAPYADALREHPGRWAVVFEGSQGAASAMATHISLGQMACFTPTGDFEATSRRQGETVLCYARYVGDGEEAAR